MKGLVVVICAPSQGGKDFIAEKTMESLALFDRKSSYATVYKIREARKSDGKHIKCVKSKEDIPIDEMNRIEDTIYESQTIVYDKKEIEEKINNGEVVFIATGSPVLAEKVKKEFGNQCFNVFVKVQQVCEEQMINEDLKRHEIDKKNASEEVQKASKERVIKRLAAYEQGKSAMLEFVQNENCGADYIFRNFYTLVGGSWNSEIDNIAKEEFYCLTNAILSIYSLVNSNKDWSRFSLSKEERKDENENLFTLQDEWLKYLLYGKEME